MTEYETNLTTHCTNAWSIITEQQKLCEVIVKKTLKVCIESVNIVMQENIRTQKYSLVCNWEITRAVLRCAVVII